jgi:hypothetical protein
MRKESPNDRVEWRLAGGEGMVAAHLSVGKKSVERGKLQPGTPFIGVGERAEASLVPHVVGHW